MREQRVRDIETEMLEASFNYLCKNGLENVSIRELCKDTGISMGSIYYWFDGKEELILDAAEYGLNKVVGEIFDYAIKNMFDFGNDIDIFLSHLLKYKKPLRFVYQLASSPQYGDKIREKSVSWSDLYDRYESELSSTERCEMKDLRPIIYLYLSSVVDYVVWEDHESIKVRLEYVSKLFTEKCK